MQAARTAWLALLLAAAPLFSGCLSGFGDKEDPRLAQPVDVGHDPTAIRVSGFLRHAFDIPSFDGTALSTVIYEPTSPDALPDGSAPKWPVAVFLHGWGQMKEYYEGAAAAGAGAAGQDPPALPAELGGVPDAPVPIKTNRLEAFARAGFIAVAYDARGFGQSGGQAMVAGPAEMADLSAVIDHVEGAYAASGWTGVVGQSYGAGQAYLAAATDPRVDAAVPMYGWVDLYEGLVPGNVPKAQWAQLLYGYGLAGSAGDYHPMIHRWYGSIVHRDGLEEVRAEMAARSSAGLLPASDVPLFICQGLQESLFPQADRAWALSGGFTRTYLFTGGHGAEPEACWERAMDWLHFFLAGFDTRVDAWPALETQDAANDQWVSYQQYPATVPRIYHLREPDLSEAEHSAATFTVEQRLAANPFIEPSALWDNAGQPTQAVPSQLREDPGAVFFTGPSVEASDVLLGAPVLRLHMAEGAQPPFQVAATLFRETEAGRSQVLSRGAAAALSEADLPGGVLEVRLHFTKADLNPGDRLVLKVGGNDPSWYMPLLADYSATFTGSSTLEVQFFGP